VYRISPLILVLLEWLMLPSLAVAEVRPEPSIIIIREGNGAATLTLSSTATSDVDVSLSVVTAVGAVNTQSSGARSLAPYLKLAESDFVLRPGEKRSVPVEASLPASTAQGEYAARVRISWREGDGEMERFVHVVLRKGDAYADIKLDKIGAVREEGEVRFSIGLLALGNAAYRGNMRMEITDQRGKVVHSLRRHVDVFVAEQLRVAVKSESMPPGRYKVVMNFDTERADLGADAIPVLPKKYTVDMKLP
jgi:hypothetical protein